MPGATNKEKMTAFLTQLQTPLTPEEQTEVDIMERVERTALPYVHFFFREWLDVFSPEDQRFYRSGGRSLFEYFYDKGVKTSTSVYHWDGNSWFQSIPPNRLEGICQGILYRSPDHRTDYDALCRVRGTYENSRKWRDGGHRDTRLRRFGWRLRENSTKAA